MTNTNTKQWDPKDHVPKYITEQLTNGGGKNSYNYINSFYQIVQLLKTQKRTGWLEHNITNPESISDHMYRMSIIAMSLNTKNFQQSFDLSKCIKISLIHDIAECLVGDIVPHDTQIDKIEKHKREYNTILYLSKIIKPYNAEFSNEIIELWLDYEEQRNFESIIIKDIDKYELLIQTFEYEMSNDVKLDEFYQCERLIKNQELKNMANDLLKKRNQYWENR
ncbi:hypothetical protein CANARDRAFT_29048 [[Candida] arabinofermentans NRRL YB-2248]|uniref:5'-deoxynucleotidase n=1 Tax=[Candida] arabinofermentans NRRL YB-2248 TaxID=983967 RepID=A0A1E4SYG6_9ASCO|nr:hypothetical protein CANARDRAFT_29048 [[Candida] arabinofermentans NRRL YB-2248]